MTRKPTHVILIGPMGVGKTTIGRALAARLGMPFRDSDEVIERTTSTDGATIALAEGVDELHRLEAWAVETLTAYPDQSVIAAAASVVDRPEGRDLLRTHLTVWLDADPEVLDHRRRQSRHRRDIDADESLRLRSLRSTPYRSVSIARVDTSRESVDDIVDRLAAIVERNRVRPRPDPDIVHRPPSEREQP